MTHTRIPPALYSMLFFFIGLMVVWPVASVNADEPGTSRYFTGIDANTDGTVESDCSTCATNTPGYRIYRDDNTDGIQDTNTSNGGDHGVCLTSLAAALLGDHGAVDPNTGWQAGDTIELAAGRTYEAGALDISTNVTRGSTLLFTLDGNCAFLSRNVTSAADSTMRVRSNGPVLVKNLYIRNTGTAGHALQVNASSNAIDDLVFENIVIDQMPAGSTSDVVDILDGGGTKTIRVTLDRFIITPNNGTDDSIAQSSSTNLAAGSFDEIYVVDCYVTGANRSGGTTANCVTGHSACKIYVRGGEFFGAGGPGIIPVTGARAFVDGAVVHGNGTLADSVEVTAEYIRNTYIYDAVYGVNLIAGSTDGAQASMDGCRIKQDRTGSRFTSNSAYGVTMSAENIQVSNTVIDGWVGHTSQASVFDASTNGAVHRFHHCYITDANRAFQYRSSFPVLLDLNHVTVDGSPGAQGIARGTVDMTGQGSTNRSTLRMNDCVIKWTPTSATNNFTVLTSNAIYDNLSGGNWIYGTVNTNGWTPAATDIVSTSGNVPTYDGYGQAFASSPQLNYSEAYSTYGVPAFSGGPVTDLIYTAVDATTNTTACILTTAVAADYYNNNTLLFTSGANAGIWRRIADTEAKTIVATNVTKVFCEVPLPTIPAIGDTVLIIGRMVPSSGNFATATSYHFAFVPTSFLPLPDIFGRDTDLGYSFARSVSTWPTMALTAPGCAANVFRPTDFRWAGNLPPPQPGTLNSPSAVNPPPPPYGGAFKLAPGKLHSQGAD